MQMVVRLVQIYPVQKSENIIYGSRVLVRPNIIPCNTKFIQWATMLLLRRIKNMTLAEPFDSKNIDATNRVCQRDDSSNWDLLLDICTLFGYHNQRLES